MVILGGPGVMETNTNWKTNRELILYAVIFNFKNGNKRSFEILQQKALLENYIDMFKSFVELSWAVLQILAGVVVSHRCYLQYAHSTSIAAT